MASGDEGIASWPALTYEQRPWVARGEGASRSALRAHSGPYFAAVVPPIRDVSVPIAPRVQAIAEEAAAHLARIDAELRVGGIAPLPAVLLRTESATSSQIERLTASARALASAEAGETSGTNAKLILANVRAMERALKHEGPVTVDSLIDVHDVLIEPDEAHAPGLRAEQVWIGGTRLGPHRATYVAPHHERVPAAMADLIAFCDRVDVPVVAKIAIAHAQFETIHPFTDGNGRTGRALIHMMLRESELTIGSTIPVSAGLLHRTEDYFEALTAFRAGHHEPIIEQVAEASIFAVTLTRKLVTELARLRADWSGRIRARRGASAWVLADALPGNPVMTAEVAQRLLGVSTPSVYVAISALEAAGVLTPRTTGRRNRIWDAREVLTVLDAFADSARRGD